MVEAVDGGVSHDAHPGVDGLRGVVKYGVEVGVCGKTKARTALLASIEYEISSIWESCHAGNDSL